MKLPLATQTKDGILTNAAQNMAGAKTFYNAAGSTVLGSFSDAGAWTLGALVTNNFNGNQHKISGNIYSANVTSTAASGELGIGVNVRYGSANAQTGRTDTTTGGMGIALSNLTSDSAPNFAVVANGAGQATTTNAVIIGSATQAGAWTFGNSTAVVSHTFRSNASLATPIIDVVKYISASGANNNFYMGFLGSSGGYDGYLQNNGSGVFTVVDVSDVRLKENIREADYGLSTISALRPVLYDRIDGSKNIKGFIAQEVKLVLPESVSIADQSAQGGLEDTHVLEMQTMIPVLVKAIQELKQQFDDYVATHP
jgi:hypothetical protein